MRCLLTVAADGILFPFIESAFTCDSVKCCTSNNVTASIDGQVRSIPDRSRIVSECTAAKEGKSDASPLALQQLSPRERFSRAEEDGLDSHACKLAT